MSRSQLHSRRVWIRRSALDCRIGHAGLKGGQETPALCADAKRCLTFLPEIEIVSKAGVDGVSVTATESRDDAGAEPEDEGGLGLIYASDQAAATSG